jgi:hypothetical protein
MVRAAEFISVYAKNCGLFLRGFLIKFLTLVKHKAKALFLARKSSEQVLGGSVLVWLVSLFL